MLNTAVVASPIPIAVVVDVVVAIPITVIVDTLVFVVDGCVHPFHTSKILEARFCLDGD